jgi:hypothetical protein
MILYPFSQGLNDTLFPTAQNIPSNIKKKDVKMLAFISLQPKYRYLSNHAPVDHNQVHSPI